MNLVLMPTKLQGNILVPSSKSMGHRELICAALANGESVVSNITVSEDITATCRILRQFGAALAETSDASGRTAYRIQGGCKPQQERLQADCSESGSTLRFLIPLGLLTGKQVTYIGHGRLVERPLLPYYDLFDEYHIPYETTQGALPLTVHGSLQAGRYGLPGNVSSQFFTGLLLALPLVAGDSLLYSTTKLESESYVDMTLDCLRRHGIRIEKQDGGRYLIPGNQHYQTGRFVTEGDYSQAAFWLAAGMLGQAVTCTGLDPASCQGDKAIIDIIQTMGGKITGTEDLTAFPSEVTGTTIDVGDCPDLVPALTVLAALAKGTTHIINAGRVRLKECDRLHAMAVELNKLGATIIEEPESLLIHGTDKLTGGRVQAWNDHRVAMALAIASQCCTDELIIEGTECVRKSYPGFWQDFAALGGIYTQEG